MAGFSSLSSWHNSRSPSFHIDSTCFSDQKLFNGFFCGTPYLEQTTARISHEANITSIIHHYKVDLHSSKLGPIVPTTEARANAVLPICLVQGNCHFFMCKSLVNFSSFYDIEVAWPFFFSGLTENCFLRFTCLTLIYTRTFPIGLIMRNKRQYGHFHWINKKYKTKYVVHFL